MKSLLQALLLALAAAGLTLACSGPSANQKSDTPIVGDSEKTDQTDQTDEKTGEKPGEKPGEKIAEEPEEEAEPAHDMGEAIASDEGMDADGIEDVKDSDDPDDPDAPRKDDRSTGIMMPE